MTLLLTLTAGLLASEAIPEPFLRAVEHIESSGRGAATPDGDGGLARGPFQWHAAAWSDCSELRHKVGLPVWPYSDARNPTRARDYARTWLTALKIRLSDQIGRQPFPGEVWLAWNLGFSGFRKYAFRWERVPAAKFAKARQVNAMAWGLPKDAASAR